MNFSRTHLTIPGTHAPWVKAKNESNVKVAISISLILHLLFLSLLATQHFTEIDRVFEIELTSLPEPVQNRGSQPQIVSPPEKQEQTDAPDKPSYRSEVDSQTAVEQIKRGDGLDAGIPNKPSDNPYKGDPQEQKEQQQVEKKEVVQEKPKEKPVEKEKPKEKTESAIKESKSSTPLKQLALDSSTLLEKFTTKEQETVTKASENSRVIDPRQYQAFSRPPGSGARFIGQQGSNDYLPNLPDGDITLLNTKADQFAVFVRRVATQVFGEIRNTGWEVLSASDVNSVTQFSTFRAILSPQGKLLKVEQLGRSGSSRFDSAIQRAVSLGARDQNPPIAAAAPDGNIHFIFQAKSWAQFSVSPRSGAPTERRWLLLATGLE